MKHSLDIEGGKSVIRLTGQLTAVDSREFDAVVTKAVAAGKNEIEVNLHGLEYMDSVGLGLLITLRDKASKAGASVALANPVGDVKDLLDMACFDKLFTIR